MTRLFLVLLCLLCTSCYNNIQEERGIEKLFNSLLPTVEHYYDLVVEKCWQEKPFFFF